MDIDNIQPNTDTADNKKKLIIKISIISITVIILLGILIIVYQLRRSKDGTEQTSLFPSASDIVNIITGKETESTSTIPLSDSVRFSKIYAGPVGGYIILENGYSVRLFDRAKGLIIDVNINSGEQKTVSDQPLLKVHDITFIDSTTFITRSYENGTITSLLYKYDQTSESGIISQSNRPTLLSNNILEISKSNNGKYLVFITKESKMTGVDLYNSETEKITRITTLPISEWIPSVTDDGIIYLSAKASKYAKSGTYRIVGDILDLVIPSQTGQTTIVSPDGKVSLSIPIYNKDTSPTVTKLTNDSGYSIKESNTNQRTIADKCVWNNISTIIFCGVPKNLSNNAPDDWYMGKASFSDTITEYNIKTGKNKNIYPTDLDIINLSVNEDKLIFKDKKTEYLYAYKLDENADLEKDYGVEESNNEETNIE